MSGDTAANVAIWLVFIGMLVVLAFVVVKAVRSGRNQGRIVPPPSSQAGTIVPVPAGSCPRTIYPNPAALSTPALITVIGGSMAWDLNVAAAGLVTFFTTGGTAPVASVAIGGVATKQGVPITLATSVGAIHTVTPWTTVSPLPAGRAAVKLDVAANTLSMDLGGAVVYGVTPVSC